MSYETMATQRTPALIIYLLDVSGSMGRKMGEKRRIEVVMDALSVALRQMVFRSTKGGRMSPRYRIAMLAYSDHVYDLLGGIKSIEEVAKLGVPELSPQRLTATAKAFQQAEKILKEQLPSLQDCPAPLICHMTDGEFTGDNPEPVVKRIMEMSVPDGNVLVENIFISDNILNETIENYEYWPGITPATKLDNEYAQKLARLSSPIPESYRGVMVEFGYHLGEDAVMLFPGNSPELISLGFQMSAATPVR